MTVKNRVSAQFSDADRARVAKSIDEIQVLLPFLVDLSAESRKELFKAGPKSRAFLELALATAQEHPEILPGGFSLDDFAEDVALLIALERPYVALRDLLRQLEDTRIVVGAEAMEAARAVYHYVQGYPGSEPLAEAREALRARFSKRTPREDGTPPVSPSP